MAEVPKVLRLAGRAVIFLLFCQITALGSQLGSAPLGKGVQRGDLNSLLQKPIPPRLEKPLHYELDPQWVGTVKTVYLRDPRHIYKDDQPEDVRIAYFWYKRRWAPSTNDQAPVLERCIGRARRTKKGGLSYLESEAAVYKQSLPSVEELSKAQTAEQLRGWFGPQHGFTDGWGSQERMHWTEGWTFFTWKGPDKLRFLHVFAHVSKAKDSQVTEIDILRIREGRFRPITAVSGEEASRYKTGDQIEADRQAALVKKRAQYPQPLRSLVEARQTPDDSDLEVYKQAISEIRRNPDPKLFEQLVTWLSHDTVEFGSFLKDIFGGVGPYELGAKPWLSRHRLKALEFTAQALPQAKSEEALIDAIVILLQCTGGGRLQVSLPEVGNLDLEGTSDGGYTIHEAHVSQSGLPEIGRLARVHVLKRLETLRNQD